MNAISPSRIAAIASSTGTTSSSDTSSPSRAKNPSSTAAMAGKYEYEIRSGTASFIRAAFRRFATSHTLSMIPAKGADENHGPHPEEAQRAVSKDGRTTRTFAAILRDARILRQAQERAPQDEVRIFLLVPQGNEEEFGDPK